MKLFLKPERFWTEIDRIEGSAIPYVLWRTLVFGFIALLVTIVEKSPAFPFKVAIPITPYEVLGVAMGALLVLRTNAGYERWWEGRKLWGGIVNQSRNLVIQALSYGPDDPDWRRQFVGWTAAFAHVSRCSLRDQRNLPELNNLVGTVKAQRIASVEHMPTAVSLAIGQLLREGVEMGMDRFAFLQAEEERAKLIDHIGGCERILKTPLPEAYSIEIRQFIFVFLVAMPFGILLIVDWLTPLVTMLVAFPILALDEIGVELQNPFSTLHLNHLPLDKICENLEQNLMSLLDDIDHSRPIENRNSAAAPGDGPEAVSPQVSSDPGDARPRDGEAVPRRFEP
jgi:ion channel-forming bestrophin family protein